MVIITLEVSSSAGYTYWESFLVSYILHPEQRPQIIKEAMNNYQISLRKFARLSGIPESTLYKISSSKIDIRLSTLTQIVKTFRSLEITDNKEPTVAVITARYALQELKTHIVVDNQRFQISEYPAATIEEEIIQGIKAQNEGCIAIICGPIAANTLNRVVKIPVIGLSFAKEQLEQAITKAVTKITL